MSPSPRATALREFMRAKVEQLQLVTVAPARPGPGRGHTEKARTECGSLSDRSEQQLRAIAERAPEPAREGCDPLWLAATAIRQSRKATPIARGVQLGVAGDQLRRARSELERLDGELRVEVAQAALDGGTDGR